MAIHQHDTHLNSVRRFLHVTGITKQGIDGAVLQSVSFQQHAGQKIAIAGETGSGKSTLLRIIAGLQQPDAGGVWFEGTRVDGGDALVPGHAGIAYLAQNFELPRSLRVEQILTYPSRQSPAQREELYELCHISHLLKRRTDELSGGERQRIALARLLTGNPKLLLLDEPYTNLDRVHQLVMKQVIDNAASLGVTCTLISHDPPELLSWPDSLLILRHGRLVQRGTPRQVYRVPRNAYVAALLGRYTALSDRSPLFGAMLREANVTGTRFIRPESIHIGRQGVPGTVRAVRFLGSHYEIDVRCGDQVVTAADPHGNLNVGDTVHVRVSFA